MLPQELLAPPSAHLSVPSDKSLSLFLIVTFPPVFVWPSFVPSPLFHSIQRTSQKVGWLKQKKGSLIPKFCFSVIGSVRFGTVWNSSLQFWFCLVQFGMIWYVLVRFITVQYGLVRFGTVWYSLVCFGTVRYGLVWFDLVWFD